MFGAPHGVKGLTDSQLHKHKERKSVSSLKEKEQIKYQRNPPKPDVVVQILLVTRVTHRSTDRRAGSSTSDPAPC